MTTFPQIASALRDMLTPAEGPLKVYKEMKEIRGLFTNKGSIIKLIKNFLVEPTIFVSKSIREQTPEKEFEAINDQLDLFCSFYTQAFKIIVDVYDVDAKLAVDLLGTSGFDYNIGDSIEDLALKHAGLNSVSIGDDIISKFNSQNFLSFGLLHGMDDPRSEGFLDFGNLNSSEMGYEERFKRLKEEGLAVKDKYGDQALAARYAKLKIGQEEITKEAFEGRKGERIRNRAQQGIKAPAGGIHGKLHEQGNYGYQIREFVISIAKTKNKTNYMIEIPITVKANIVFVRPEEIINALMPKHDDKSIFARWDKWRSGGIKFWKDLVLCSDLIKEYKQNKLKDKEDVMGKISSSEIAGMTKGAMTGHIGYERFYNMYLVTASDRQKIEQYLRGKLDSPKFKESFLIKANGLSIMVLDPDWELAHVYLKDINKPSVIKFDRMGKRKPKDGSLNEVFKSLFSQQSPVF